SEPRARISCASRSWMSRNGRAGARYGVVVRTIGTPRASTLTSTVPRRPLVTSSNWTAARSSSNGGSAAGNSHDRNSSATFLIGGFVVAFVHAEAKLVAVVDEGVGPVLRGIELAKRGHALRRRWFHRRELSVDLEEGAAALVNGLGLRAPHDVAEARGEH